MQAQAKTRPISQPKAERRGSQSAFIEACRLRDWRKGVLELLSTEQGQRAFLRFVDEGR